MRITLLAAVTSFCFLCNVLPGAAAAAIDGAGVDSDHDGLSDATEQLLLERFLPSFWIDANDCAGVPAEFVAGQKHPIVASANSTIYGQATPRKLERVAESVVELRYYHLWGSDCGSMGHALDAEHVSVLVQMPDGTDGAGAWKALYWYAAAHENTICDDSQITRATTLDAETAGATVWISRGKHASFLDPQLCRHGCGGDMCQEMRPLEVTRIVNLGEAGNPMNDTLWAESAQWPLAAKMARSDFDPQVLAKIEAHPGSDIAWVNPSLTPAQSTIAAGGSTWSALGLANRKTDTALSTARGATGSSLGTAYDKVGESLKKSARGVGRFLRGDLHDSQAKQADHSGASGRPAAANTNDQ